METRIQELIAEGVPLQYAMRIYQAEEAGKEAISISHELIHSAVSLLYNRRRWEEHSAACQLLIRLNKAAMRLYPSIQISPVTPLLQVEHQHGREAEHHTRPNDSSVGWRGGNGGCASCWLCSRRAAGSQADSDLLRPSSPRATCWQRSLPTGDSVGATTCFTTEFVEVVLDMNCALAFAH